MAYKEPETIQEFIDLIATDIQRAANEPLDVIGGYIVGATWGNSKVDIMEMDDYPELVTLADLAAELETIPGHDDIQQKVWDELLASFEKLKIQALKK